MIKTETNQSNIVEINSISLHDKTAIIHMPIEAWKMITDQLKDVLNFHMQNTTYTQVRDRMFRSLFKEKNDLLSLYNAIANKDYNNPNDLEIVTLEGAIYLGMKNDISFIISSSLFLYEHQSTDNKNMPLRDLFYIAEQYRVLTANQNLYSTHQIHLPTPHFVVLYNGNIDKPDKFEYRLSDAYLSKENAYDLDLRVSVININQGHNSDMMMRCKTLEEFSKFTEILRTYNRTLASNQAISATIDYCISHDILADYLLRNKAEVKDMVLYEFDLEKYKRDLAKELREDITEEVTNEITEKITNEVTEKVTNEVTEKVTNEVTEKVTNEVTEKVTNEVTEKLTSEITERVTKEVQKKANQRILELNDENQQLRAQLAELQAKTN